MKIIDKNKKAFFDYFIDEKLEAGIALKGSEVKSIRAGDVSLKDCFCHIDSGEIVLKNCYIAPYSKGSYFNEEPRRDRKLLLHRREIDRLIGKIKEKGFTIIPLTIYFTDRLVKLEIGLCKGKKLHDKRQSIKEKDIEREQQREIANYK